MAYKLKTALGTVIYSARKCTVEPVLGIIKEVLGFRQFSLRGREAAAGEWALVCLAFNLKRLHTLVAGDARRLGARVPGCDPARPDGLALRHLRRGLILFYHHGSAFVAGPSGRWWRAFSPTDC